MECRGPYACGNGAYALVPERYWPMTNQRMNLHEAGAARSLSAVWGQGDVRPNCNDNIKKNQENA